MINKKEAIEIACKKAKDNGWPIWEPFQIVTRRRWWTGKIFRYEIEDNAGYRGTKSRFTIDAETGKILDEGHLPR